MQTIQLNIQKPVRYKSEFEIKHGSFIQIINNHIIFEGKSVKDISYLDQDKIDSLFNMKSYSLYAHYMILEYFKDTKRIFKNMDFNSFKLATLNELLKDQEYKINSVETVVNKMISSFDYKISHFNTDNKEEIVKSISSGIPITATCKFSMNETSEGFENTVLVYGIIRDSEGNIVGVNAHDYAGNANSNYQNRNGESVVYSGQLFNKMFKNSVIGIPVEENL